MKTICIMCPVGCEIAVNKTGSDITVTGNACARGKDYGIKELTKPERMLTTIVPLPNGKGTISLKTERSIDKRLIKAALIEINQTKPNAKAKPGDVFLKNILNTNVNIVVTCINQEK